MEYKGFDKNYGLDNKVALITGASKGIGKAIAILFAEKGADSILVDIDKAVKEVANDITKISIKCLSLIYDITKNKNVKKIVKDSLSEFGKIGILVNNAGASLVEDAEKITEEYWDKTMDVNAKAPFLLSQHVGREMIKRKYGKIINIESIAGEIAFEKNIAYCASKAAVILMTKVLALEWGKYNINVNSISPIFTLTEMGKKVWLGSEIGEIMRKKIPTGRFNYPEEIAAAAVYLANDATDMITGKNLVFDGGYSIQ